MYSVEFVAPDKPELSPVLQTESATVLQTVVKQIRIWKLFSPTITHITWDFAVLHPARSTALLILALPPVFTPTDLAEYVNQMSPFPVKITIITHIVNAAIVEFVTQKAADRFYINTLGEPFLETHPLLRCIPLFLKEIVGFESKISCSYDEECPHDFSFSGCPLCFQLFDPFITTFFSPSISNDVSDEAYDEWGQPPCPVCHVIHRHEFSTCSSCSQNSRLWICLVCGHVGCGRDQEQHAVRHYEVTGHRFALRFDDNWLWDYEADRSLDRSFHDRQPEGNADAITHYRQMLLSSIGEIMDDEARKCAKLHSTTDPLTNELQGQVDRIHDQQKAVDAEYQAAVALQEQLDAVRLQITQTKELPVMVAYDQLSRENHLLRKKLDDINRQIDVLCQHLDDRQDVSQNVFVDIE